MSGGGSIMEIRSLTARATNAERRLINLQNQLAASEEKMTSVNQKTQAADSKWEARVKEYESRLRAAEERVKRERQGAKERTTELEAAIKCVLIFCGDNNWMRGHSELTAIITGHWRDSMSCRGSGSFS
jgi:predicted  nucleic acid-binding Zn-ribbon protein